MDIIASLQSIGFDWQVALAHLVNFLLVLWLLQRFVFGPLRDTIEERRERIETGVEDAKAAEQKRHEAQQERKEILREARQKRQEIISKARDQAAEITDQAKTRAQQTAAEILAAGREQIAEERERMQEDMEEQVSELALRSAEKILQREITTEDHDKYVQKAITAVGSNA